MSPGKIGRYAQHSFAARPGLLIESFHFLEAAIWNEPRQIGFDHRPFHFPLVGRRIIVRVLNGPRFDDLNPRPNEQVCQPRADDVW